VGDRSGRVCQATTDSDGVDHSEEIRDIAAASRASSLETVATAMTHDFSLAIEQQDYSLLPA
jgi:hypothetical protein